MAKQKAIKQKYNQILRDPERRAKHFGSGGALGDEKEGRSAGDRIHVELHNEAVRNIVDFGEVNESATKKVEELKKGKKIVLGGIR
jgi:hypothetical protein